MPEKRPAKAAASKKAPANKAASRKAAVDAPAAKPAKAATKKARAPQSAEKAAPVPPDAPAKKAPARRAPGAAPVQKTRVVVPMGVYDAQKDAIKAPLKEREMKWNFLGEGKGIYKRADNTLHCFVQFKDDGVHYSIWGDDKAGVEDVLGTWRELLGDEAWAKATASGEEAVDAEKEAQVSEAVKLWQLAEPQRRPGEPDFFFSKRVAEWQAKRPA